LDDASGGLFYAQMWWIAEYVADIMEQIQAEAVAAKIENRKRRTVMVGCWDDEQKCMVDRPAHEVLADKHWIKTAGARELRKRANRGSVVHEAVEDWAYGQRFDFDDDDELGNYVGGIIEGLGFALPVEYCNEYVRQVLRWLDEHVKRVEMAEAPVFNFDLGAAGTVDLIAELHHYNGLWMLDFKSSKDDQPTFECQMAAYANMRHAGIKNTDKLVPLPRVDHVANVFVQPDGVRMREWRDETDVPGGPILNRAYAAYMYLLNAWGFLTPKRSEADGKKHARHPVTIKAPKTPRERIAA
jgi:hypothetical protein